MKALFLLTVCSVFSYAYAVANLAEHLQARKGSKREWLDAFPEGLVLNRQQGNVALNANGQHLSYELLIISSSLHLHLCGRQMVQAPEGNAAQHSEQSEAIQLHTLPFPRPVMFVLVSQHAIFEQIDSIKRGLCERVMMKQQLARTSE